MNTRNSLRSAARFLSATLLVGLLAMTAFAQGGTSTVRGTVKDPAGNVVAGANVKLISVGTNATRDTTTSDEGVFSFEAVQVGDYRVEVEAPNFKKSVQTDIHALVASPVTLDVKLEVGNIAESVTVSTNSAEQLVNREDGSLGTNFVNKQITQLPLEARNVPNLLTLQTAATRDGYVAGARADQTNVTLDGVDINEAQTNSIVSSTADPADATSVSNLDPTNSTVLRLNADAIEEFRVQTTNPNANQGRSAGAQVALVTKSGTNDWHGAGFEFYRTKAFTANDFFSNAAGVERPSLIRHTFGGSIGGPVVKDRVFFFYSFEGDRITRSQSVARVVPLAHLGLGQVRFRSPSGALQTLTSADITSLFPAVGVNPLAIAVLGDAASRYPANDTTLGDGLNTGGFRFNAAIPVERNSHAAKFDFNLTGKQQAFVRTNIIYDNITRIRQFPDTPAPTIWSHPIGIAAGHTWTLTNNIINTFRYGFTREAFSDQGDSAE
ncbi:MAG TPA: carboxypeptidase-like regulatory domain-containing protein, partial [Pyrinomonadaceae bacterium]|nr:carboxypeptidase-like regulatory domain-containing protein [Pyrinomonadaceae bacterium]